jgi:hypothetical protein
MLSSQGLIIRLHCRLLMLWGSRNAVQTGRFTTILLMMLKPMKQLHRSYIDEARTSKEMNPNHSCGNNYMVCMQRMTQHSPSHCITAAHLRECYIDRARTKIQPRKIAQSVYQSMGTLEVAVISNSGYKTDQGAGKRNSGAHSTKERRSCNNAVKEIKS